MPEQTDHHAPTPYQPEEGAVICLAGTVPDEGWEVRSLSGDVWDQPDDWEPSTIVEARRIPRPGVTITLVEVDREVGVHWLSAAQISRFGRVRTLVREARAAQ